MVALPEDNVPAAVTDLIAALLAHVDSDPFAADLVSRIEAFAASRPNQGERAFLFSRLAVLARGDAARAERLVNRAFNCAERVTDPEERIEALCEISRTFDRGGIAIAAKDAAERAGRLCAELPLSDGRKRSILAVGAVLGQVEGVARGIEWVEPLQDASTIDSDASTEEITVDDVARAAPSAPAAPARTETNGHLSAASNGVHESNGSETSAVHHSHRRRRRH